MVVNKAFICLCEDVTVDELLAAIQLGYRDIEEIKRITGIGTGPCQGKQCLHILRQVLSNEAGVPIEQIPLTTLRTPIVPVRFGQWAARGDDEEEAR